MKILLLTDIPPCKNFTAGLVLDQLCRFLPRGSIACFAITNPDINPRLSADLEWIPVEYAAKPREFAVTWPKTWRRGTRILTALREEWNARVVVPQLLKQAAAFGRRQKVDAVWAVLQGQTLVRLAAPLAKELGAPLITHVWDPLFWWLIANDIDRRSSKVALNQFDETLRASRACLAASWAMAEHYRGKYGTFSVPVISSHDRSLAAEPEPHLLNGEDVVIGMAGQFYAVEEWHQLIAALKAAAWKVAGRNVKLKVLGHYVPVSDVPEGRLEFLGWRSQREVIETLSRADLLYCPYPFAGHMEEVSKLSFPSKVVSYLAAGRPILFHGPGSSSPARYLQDRGAAFLATSFHAPAIYNEIQRAVENPGLYADVARHGQAAFRADFTLERMEECFFQVLGTTKQALEDEYRDYVPEEPVVSRYRVGGLHTLVAGPYRAVHLLAGISPGARHLLRERERLAEELQERSAHLEGIGAELHQLYAYAGRLTDECAELKAQAADQGRQREGIASERDRLTEELQERSAHLEAIGAELHQLYAYAGRITDECAELKGQAADQRRQLEGIASERDGVLAEHRQLLAAHEHLITEQKVAYDTYHRETGALSRHVGLLEGELGALTRRHEEAQTKGYHDLTATAERASAMQAERDALRGERDALAAARNELAAAHERLAASRDNELARILGKLSLLEYRLDNGSPELAASKPAAAADSVREVRTRYLDLIEASLVGTLGEDPGTRGADDRFDADTRFLGRDWPRTATTMIGTVRMRNLRHLTERVLADHIPGDLIETGVWRGGACIYMRAILAAYGATDRAVWVADSFCGLPPPDAEHFPADSGDTHHTFPELAVPLEEVKANFARYGLLDCQVKFLPGWFRDTLPTAPIDQLALLRLDGDMYESTIEALDALYPKLAPGGFVIVDDYILAGCRAAVDDFRRNHAITGDLEEVDAAAVFWRKPQSSTAGRKRPRRAN